MRATACLAIAGLVGGCAMTMERPVEPFQSETIEIAPNAFYESCVTLEAGDRLLFSYLADPPMAFSIRRYSDNASVSYVMRDLSRDESGIFFVPESHEYCLHWTPPPGEVSWPTLLKYNFRLLNKPAP